MWFFFCVSIVLVLVALSETKTEEKNNIKNQLTVWFSGFARALQNNKLVAIMCFSIMFRLCLFWLPSGF